MHLTRAEMTNKIPVPRKGTVYRARALSHNEKSVPVVFAVRDMLKLARTSSEVKNMIKNKTLKINGRVVKDYREPIILFSVFEADQSYVLKLLPSGRFNLEKTTGNGRVAKVVGKTTLSGKKEQINLHDGTNFISKEKISIGDSVHLEANKPIKIIHLDKGKKVFIESGSSAGMMGVVKHVENNEADIEIDGRTVRLKKSQIIAL